MVFKTGQVEWSVPLKALEESIQQLIVLFIFWPFQCEFIEHTCTFFPYTDLLSSGILNIKLLGAGQKNYSLQLFVPQSNSIGAAA